MKVTVEVGDNYNRNWLFQPTSETLRGSWANSRLPGIAMHQAVAVMPDIPGIRISVDVPGRSTRVYDPLKEDQKLWDKISSIIENNIVHFGSKMKPMDDQVNVDCEDDHLKTFLFWLRRGVDSGNAKVVAGELPTMEEILEMPGDAKISQFNSQVSRTLTANKDTVFGRRHAIRKGKSAANKAEAKTASTGSK